MFNIKTLKYFGILTIVFLILTGCDLQSVDKIEIETFMIEKKVVDKDLYEFHKEINDPNTLQDISKILSRIQWTTTEIDIRPADYILTVNDQDSYQLWINGDTLELINNDLQYASLNKSNSAKLFNLLMDKKLPKDE